MKTAGLFLSTLISFAISPPVIFAQATAPGGALKKITIVSSNNTLLEDGYKHLLIPKAIDDSDYGKLKKYVLSKTDLQAFGDPEIIIKALEWVSTQWEHDSFNRPPENATSHEILRNAAKGRRYRCVEYGKVLSDLLLSLGYVSRTVGLKNIAAAYGSLGMGHVASEVWSDSLQKWIFVDPQFSIYAKRGDEFINFYEMYQLKQAGKFNEIRFIPTDTYLKLHHTTQAKEAEDYRVFIEKQFGYIDTAYVLDDGDSVSATLPLEGRQPYLTFQGLPREDIVFTHKLSDLYFSINRTLIIFEYQHYDKTIFKKLHASNAIQSDQAYMNAMPLFAAQPNFKLKFENNMPWFDHYQAKIDDGAWTAIKGHTFDWSLHEGGNTIAVRSVNKAGLSGMTTAMEITYE